MLAILYSSTRLLNYARLAHKLTLSSTFFYEHDLLTDGYSFKVSPHTYIGTGKLLNRTTQRAFVLRLPRMIGNGEVNLLDDSVRLVKLVEFAKPSSLL